MASTADNSVDSPPMRIGSAPNINNLSSRRAPDDYGDAGAVNDYPSSARMAPAVPQASTNSAAAPSPPPPTRSRSSSSRDRNSNSSDSSSNSPSSAIPSFTSDSPYLHSYIDREMRNLAVLTETLRDISARARTFGKCGALMAEATRRLSSSCRLNPPSTPSEKGGRNSTSGEDVESDEQMRVMKERQESIGDEMTSVLSVLGEILDEVADAQVSMCQSLEASLSLSLEAFAGVELNEATRLRSEADVMSENAEGSFSRYMHGRHTERANMAGGVGGDGVGSNGGPMAMDAHDQHNFVTSWNKLSEHVGGSQFKTWNRAASNEFNNSSSEDGGGAPNKEPGRRLKNLRDRISKGKEDGDNIEKDPSLATAEAAANLRHNLEQMRLTQANAELKRFQLLRRLDSIKTRRNFELGESTLASLNGLRAYFHHCSDMIDGITPKLTRLQDKQAQSREKHDAQQAPWETKQRSLTNAIGEVGAGAASAGAIAEALSKGQVEDLDEHILTGHPLTLEEIESNVHFWELQRQLNIGSLYQRKPTSGVFVEGWLYKKSSSRISLNPWSRRWFILDKKGVHYLKCGGEGGNKEDNSNGNKSNSNDWMERIKVCDILLCTVREINCKSKGNPNLRFCFEIISPNSKAYLLQACGPDDYKMWVNGIRSCIEQQLVHGKLPPENMLLGSGKPSKKLGRNRSRGKSDNESSDSITDDDNANLDRRSSSEFSDDLPGNSPPTPRTGIRNPLVPKILEANTVCADCGNLDPDWASLNLGVVVCIECSGVHRSLGVHVSKVRSLRLDTCREYEYNLLVELGNERVNSIYEAGLHHQKGWTKPKGSAPRKAKEEWIKSKYLWKGFLEYLPEDGREQEDREAKFSRDLYEAARVGNLFAIQEALAKGGSVGWKNEKEGGKAALHICVVGRPPDEDDISDWKGMQCAELLIQNGSKLDAEDFDHHKALDCAVVGNGRREMIEYLSARSSPA